MHTICVLNINYPLSSLFHNQYFSVSEASDGDVSVPFSSYVQMKVKWPFYAQKWKWDGTGDGDGQATKRAVNYIQIVASMKDAWRV